MTFASSLNSLPPRWIRFFDLDRGDDDACEPYDIVQVVRTPEGLPWGITRCQRRSIFLPTLVALLQLVNYSWDCFNIFRSLPFLAKCTRSFELYSTSEMKGLCGCSGTGSGSFLVTKACGGVRSVSGETTRLLACGWSKHMLLPGPVPKEKCGER